MVEDRPDARSIETDGGSARQLLHGDDGHDIDHDRRDDPERPLGKPELSKVRCGTLEGSRAPREGLRRAKPDSVHAEE